MESITPSTISSPANQWIFEPSAFPVSLVNAVGAILEDVAEKIEEVRVIAHNKCPWALYRSKSGHRCAQFIPRNKFSGYHYNILHDGAILTDLANGEQYSTNGHCCDCDDFTNWCYATGEKCEHMIKLDEHMAELAAAEALPPAPARAAEPLKIDLRDLPLDCDLVDSQNWLRTDLQQFFVMVPEKTPRAVYKKIIGQISESLTGSEILAYTDRAIVKGQKFSTTYDAVAFLMRSVGLQPERNWKLAPLQPNEIFPPDTDYDLDYNLSPGDRLTVKWAGQEDGVYVDEDGCIPW